MDLQAILDAPSSSSSDDVPYSKYRNDNCSDYKASNYAASTDCTSRLKQSASDEYNYKPSSYEDGLSDISSALNEEGSFGLGGPPGTSFRDSYRCTSNSYDSEELITNVTKFRGGGNLELERILRDDDEDGSADDADVIGSAKKKVHNARDLDILHSILNEDDDENNNQDENDEFSKYAIKRQDLSVHSTNLNSSYDASLYSAGQPTTIPLSHSMEVDAILDSVGDDDSDGNEQDINSSYLKYHQRMLSLNTNSGEEDADEEGVGLNFNFSKASIMRSDQDGIAYENMFTQYKLSRRVQTQDDDHGGEIYLHESKVKSSLEEEQSLKGYTASFLHRHKTKTCPGEDKITTSDATEQLAAPLSEDQQNEQISDMCFHSAELYERRLLKPNNRNVVSPLTVKRRMKPKVTLQSKSRMSQSANTQQPQSQPRFGFSGGIIQVKSMADLGSHILKSNAQQTISQRDFDTEMQGGLPTTMAVNSKFIAVGTQRGEVWIFDLFEQLKNTLGNEESTTGIGNSKKTHSVTSIDLPIHGDYLLAGYGSGAIVLWDVIRGVALKGMHDLHSSPITSVRLTSFPIAYSSGNDSDIGAVSVDASGLVNKVVFTKGMLWSSYSAETECLLDGTAGQILAMDTLPPLDAAQYPAMDYHPSAYKIVLIALSSDRSSFAVSVLPKVSVLHRWARPEANRIDPTTASEFVDDGVSDVTMSYAPTYISSLADPNSSGVQRLPFLPCLSWGWGLISGGKNSVTPILARSWGCCIQFLCANFPPREEGDVEPDNGEIHWPAFGLHDEFDASDPVVSLNWLGSRSLVYLTVSNEFTIIDTVIMTMQERLDFSGMKLVYAEFALSRPKSKESNLCTTFMNSIRSNDNRLLILCEEEVKQITVLGITQQIASLEEGGQWLEALALALDHYESTIQSQEDRQRNSIRNITTYIDENFLTEDEIWMAELLMRYLLLAIENAPEPEMYSANSRLNLAQSHFEMLSGVCLEYCVTMKRLDLLFGPIFRCFYEARYINVFLDVMETYILNDRLKYIAPETMVLFVAHCKDMKDISMVERCLLHMDCSLMDFDSILSLLKKNALYTGLLHIYSTGLDDYTSPLEILFEAVFDAFDSSNCIQSDRRKDGVLGSKFEQYGFKALMYLRYCLAGKTFPQGEQTIPEDRVHTLRAEIFELILREVAIVSHHRHGAPTQRRPGIRSSSYPYIRALVLVDSKAFLDSLAIVLDDEQAKFDEAVNIGVVGSWDVEYGTDNDRIGSRLGIGNTPEKDPKLLPDRQFLVNILSSVLMTEDIVTFDNQLSMREPSQVTTIAKNAFLDFLVKYLELGFFTAPRYLTADVITRLCSKSKKGTSEDQVLSLLKALPRSSYELDEILYTVERTQMTRSALFLYQSGVSRTIDKPSMIEKCERYFNRAIDCFLKDKDVEFRKNLFGYAKKECATGGSFAANDVNSSPVLRRVLLKRISELVELDAVQTAKLVGELFVEDIDTILSSLKGIDSGRVQYYFLHAITSDLFKVDAAAAKELNANLTSDHQHSYLSLMSRFEPDMVYPYLSTNQNYRLEDALKLCQERRITDGSAYLLERMGDISGAIVLMLQTLDTRIIGLKNIIQESMSGVPASRLRVANVSIIKADLNSNEAAMKEMAGAKQTLGAVLDLCERNKNDHLIIDNEKGPLLWFHVLDRLVNAKHLLGGSKHASQYHLMAISTVLSELLLMTMQRMTHHVSHYDLMQKITGDHAGNDLGEFREMLVCMLKTYSTELDVCSSAVNVMHHDIRNLSVQRKNLKVRGSFIQEQAKSLAQNATIEIQSSGSSRVFTDRRSDYNSRILHSRSSVSQNQPKRYDAQRYMIGCIRQNKKGQGNRALNFMTASERHYSSGDSMNLASYSFDDGGSRLVGALTVAQNVGGLF